MELINLNDYEIKARDSMDPLPFDYFAGGSDDELTLRENRLAFSRIKLRPRVLRGIDECDTSIRLSGHRLSAPILIAPTAMHGLAAADGELAVARAARAEGILMIQSTTSSYPMKEISDCAPGSLWFQLYVHKNRSITRWLIESAERMGFSALVVTVDTPVLGNRERDKKNDFTLQAFKEKIHFLSMQGSQAGKAGSSLNDYAHSELKAAASWEDIGWILSVTALPVWLKGICHPEDARLATTHGIAGVIVSNHGGRQLDSMPATIELLPEIISAVEGRLPVLIDGGIRRGTDVLKALALGASAVAIGRPVLWGLAVGGEAGVQSVLRILRNELERAMWLCGIASIGQISRDILF